MNMMTYVALKALFVLLVLVFCGMFVATFWNHGLAVWLADVRTAVLAAGLAGLFVGVLYAIREGARDYWKGVIDFMWNAWSFVAVSVFFYAVLWKLPAGQNAPWSFDFLGLLQAMPPFLKVAWFGWATFAAAAKVGIALADAQRAVSKASQEAA